MASLDWSKLSGGVELIGFLAELSVSLDPECLDSGETQYQLSRDFAWALKSGCAGIYHTPMMQLLYQSIGAELTPVKFYLDQGDPLIKEDSGTLRSEIFSWSRGHEPGVLAPLFKLFWMENPDLESVHFHFIRRIVSDEHGDWGWFTRQWIENELKVVLVREAKYRVRDRPRDPVTLQREWKAQLGVITE